MATILVVDDETSVLALVSDILERGGHTVTQARDGNAALRALKTGPFHLMVTDLVMPDKEGIETIIQARKQWPALKVIAISGAGRGRMAHYLDLASRLGAEATVEKPVTAEILLDTVRAVLDAPAAPPPTP